MNLDLILVGGGLANCLIAYRLSQLRPELSWLIVERETRLGGNHTWSFHQTDLNASQHAWLQPFVEHSWPHYDVAFPGLQRRLMGGYHSFTGSRLDTVMRSQFEQRIHCECKVVSVQPERVVLENGNVLSAPAVIDARGASGSKAFELAYQKFLGRVIDLREPHGLVGALLKDATVAQHDGYRFIYVLPLDTHRILIEDTYYADGPELDRQVLGGRIDDYLESRKWRVEKVLREEHGVLPIVLSGDIEAFWEPSDTKVPRAGLSAALFNPVTGYSLPEAVRLADALGRFDTLCSPDLYTWIKARSTRLWQKNRFYRLLNRMLFRAAEPAQRYRVLQRFYTLPEGLIARFYAGTLTSADKIRVVTGKPPVPIFRALPCLLGDSRGATQ